MARPPDEVREVFQDQMRILTPLLPLKRELVEPSVESVFLILSAGVASVLREKPRQAIGPTKSMCDGQKIPTAADPRAPRPLDSSPRTSPRLFRLSQTHIHFYTEQKSLSWAGSRTTCGWRSNAPVVSSNRSHLFFSRAAAATALSRADTVSSFSSL